MTSKHHMEIEKPARNGGYKLEIFVDSEVAKTFVCAICKNVLRNPVQIPQSNNPKRACQDCYKDSIRYVIANLMFSAYVNVLIFLSYCTEQFLLKKFSFKAWEKENALKISHFPKTYVKTTFFVRKSQIHLLPFSKSYCPKFLGGLPGFRSRNLIRSFEKHKK